MLIPIRARLTLAFAIVMAVVLAATGIVLYIRFKRDFDIALNDRLLERATSVHQDLGADTQRLRQTALVGSEESFVQIEFPDGALVSSTPLTGAGPLIARSEIVGAQGPRYSVTDVPTRNGAIEARTVALATRNGTVIIVGSSLEERSSALQRFVILLAAGGVVTFALATLIAWLLARAALRPVERMRSETAAISTSEPGRRIPVPETGDELDRLAHTLNEMLERIEKSFERERRFVDDASHELRTPLGILRTELELALRRSRTKEELEQALRSAAQESDRLNRLANDLLVLARSDRGKLHVRREPVNGEQLLAEVVAEFSAPSTQAGVRLQARFANGTELEADGTRLRQALGNLVDNAIRHSQRGDTVGISMTVDGGRARIEVTDQGEGFPEEFLARAFDPFTRAESSRTRKKGGTGLGLSIVKAIAEAHNGTVSAENLPAGGARVQMELPA